jgi:hypothetical protein
MGTGRHTFFAVALALGAIFVAHDAVAQERGYQARACGFDLDGDGVIGEPGDDCNICDGQTKDPDGDGKNEDLIYVDCGAGNDNGSCGAPGSPCRTIQYAWSSRADGPGDGAEDIICFTGVCKTLSDYKIPGSGVATGGDGGSWYNTRTAAGNQVRSFRYPANPTMLVGWDKDNDGRYPPTDTDDTAVLDGGPNKLGRALNFALIPDHVELAHFAVKDYGRYASGGERGFVRLGSAEKSGTLTGVYMHDLKLSGINRGVSAASTIIAFNLFGNSSEMKWMAFENIDAQDIGAWFIRGGVGQRGDSIGPFRFQNISLRMYAARGGGHGMKMWGFNRGVEVLDNRFDGNPRAWNPSDLKTLSAIMVSSCSQDWDIVNNEVFDFRVGLWLNSKNPVECTERPVNDIRFERNTFRNTFQWEGVMPVWVHQEFLEPRDDLTCSTNTDLQDYVIANNFLSSDVGYKACYVDQDGNNCRQDEGTAVFVNNTCHGKLTRNDVAAIQVGDDPAADNDPKNRQRNFIIWNNIVSGVGLSGGQSDLNVSVKPTPPNWSAGHNVFDPAGKMRWGSNTTNSLSTWRNASGAGSGTVACNPAFVNASAGDFHLASSDDCANDRGEPMSSIIALDFDAGKRPSGTWDAGADEFGVAGEAGSGGTGGGGGGGSEPAPPSKLPAPELREVVPLPN